MRIKNTLATVDYAYVMKHERIVSEGPAKNCARIRISPRCIAAAGRQTRYFRREQTMSLLTPIEVGQVATLLHLVPRGQGLTRQSWEIAV
jgi:hypothetical protein